MKLKSMHYSLYLCVAFGLLFLFITNAFSLSFGHKFLFRKIYGEDPRNCVNKESILEMTPLIQTGAKVSAANFFYLPEKNQYIVKALVEFSEKFDVEAGRLERDKSVWRHLLLDAQGDVVDMIDADTGMGFSRHSGMFFSHSFYVDWLGSGSQEKRPYHAVFNADVNMSYKVFLATFVELYDQAEYIEFMTLRPSYPAGVVFKIKGKWVMLLSGHHDLKTKYIDEDPRTGVREDVVALSFSEPEKYGQSSPLIKAVPLASDIENYSLFYNYPWKRKLKVDKFQKTSSEPPFTVTGTAYISLNSNGGRFKFKIPHVVKYWFWPMYDLSVRTFTAPQHKAEVHPLTFVEVTQTQGVFGQFREGVGVYAITKKPCDEHVVSSDLPDGITESRFSELPINLQRALMRPKETRILTVSDKVYQWLPEIELLENLIYLNLKGTEVNEIPGSIGDLSELRVLNLSMNATTGFKILENNRVETFTIKGVQLPSSITNLQKLRKVYMSFTGLSEFPSELLSLPGLCEIDVAHNPISEIPEGISHLKNLEQLGLEGTNVTSLPESMAFMRNLRVTGLRKEDFPEKFHHLFTQR